MTPLYIGIIFLKVITIVSFVIVVIVLLKRIALMDKERDGWNKERKELLDRIMSVDYTKFVSSQMLGVKSPEDENVEPYDRWTDEQIVGTVQSQMPDKEIKMDDTR